MSRGGTADPRATTADVDRWQARITEVLRAELDRRGRKHLVFGSQAFSYKPAFRQELDASFSGKEFDAVNVHPLPGLELAGRKYMLGNFMSKQLVLKDFRDFCRAAGAFSKPCVPDEDNAASMYRDPVGWTIHRKRAWTALLSGCHYDFIDFSITVGSEAGTRDSSRMIRTWMKHLSEFMRTVDIVHSRPAPDWIGQKPAHLVDVALAGPRGDYVAYLADDREAGDPESGRPISGSVSFRVPSGRYEARLYSPRTGEFSPGIAIQAGEEPAAVSLAPFEHDVVLRVTRLP